MDGSLLTLQALMTESCTQICFKFIEVLLSTNAVSSKRAGGRPKSNMNVWFTESFLQKNWFTSYNWALELVPIDHEKHLKAAVWWGLPQIEAFLDLQSPGTSFPGSNFLRIHLSMVSVGRCESLLGDHKAFCHGQLNPKDRLHSYMSCGWLIATFNDHKPLPSRSVQLFLCLAHGWSVIFGSNDEDRSTWTSGTCATNP